MSNIMTIKEVADILNNCANGACDKCCMKFETYRDNVALLCEEKLIEYMGAECRKIAEEMNKKEDDNK